MKWFKRQESELIKSLRTRPITFRTNPIKQNIVGAIDENGTELMTFTESWPLDGYGTLSALRRGERKRAYKILYNRYCEELIKSLLYEEK